MYRIGWKLITVPEGWTEPTNGKSTTTFNSVVDAGIAINEHFANLIGPPILYWVETEDGEVVASPTVDPYRDASKPIADVVEFHRAFGLDVCSPRVGEEAVALLELRMRLLKEEFDEVTESARDLQALLNDPDSQIDTRPYWAAFLKELSDLRYVTYGAGIVFGLPLDEGYDRVHKSNMSKLVDGKPLMREDGKVLKGPNYKPADLLDLIY